MLKISTNLKISYSFSFIIIINVVVSEPDIFFWIPESTAKIATINTNDISILLVGGVSTALVSGNPIFVNGPRSKLRNPSHCIVFENVSVIILYNLKINLSKCYKNLEIVYLLAIIYVKY